MLPKLKFQPSYDVDNIECVLYDNDDSIECVLYDDDDDDNIECVLYDDDDDDDKSVQFLFFFTC